MLQRHYKSADTTARDRNAACHRAVPDDRWPVGGNAGEYTGIVVAVDQCIPDMDILDERPAAY